MQAFQPQDVTDFELPVVLLQIRSNDLCDPAKSPESVTTLIIDLSDKMV